MNDLDQLAAAPPLVVWVVIGVTCLLLVMRGLSSFMEPLGAFLEKRRAFRQAAEDARIRDLDGQVSHLSARVDELELKDHEQLKLLTAHTSWDYEVLNALLRHGISVDSPPPLRAPLQRKGTK